MAMKRHGITMQGPFILEKQSILPQFDSDQEGRLVYNSAEKAVYYASENSFVTRPDEKVNIPMYESNGNILWDDMGEGLESTWVHETSSAGYTFSSTAIFGKSCKLITSPSAAAVTEYIKITRTTSVSVPAKFTMTAKFYAPTASVPFEFKLTTLWGEFIFGGANTIPAPCVWTGTVLAPKTAATYLPFDISPTDWYTLTFAVDYGLSTSATCNAFLNGICIARNIACNHTGAIVTSDIKLEVIQYSNGTTGNQTLYIDYIKLGTDLIEINKDDTYGINNYFKVWDNKSYIMGGSNLSNVCTDEVQRILHSSDLVHILSQTLNTYNREQTGLNSNVAGYTIGGSPNGNEYATVVSEKICFANDNIGTIDNTLDNGYQRAKAAGLSSKFSGYTCGGGTSTVNAAASSTVNKMTFASEAIFSLSTTLTKLNQVRTSAGGIYTSTMGYIMGGNTGSDPVATTERMTFTTENIATSSATLATTGEKFAACFSSSAGYLFSGTAYVGSILKYVFSGDTCSTIGSTLNDRTSASGSNSTGAGYIAGGNTGSASTTIDKFGFLNDTANILVSSLSGAKKMSCSVWAL